MIYFSAVLSYFTTSALCLIGLSTVCRLSNRYSFSFFFFFLFLFFCLVV